MYIKDEKDRFYIVSTKFNSTIYVLLIPRPH